MTMGGVALGAAVMGLITPRAPSNDILNQLIKDKPEFYKFIDIDLSTARDNQPYDEPGTFIWVDNQFARGEVTLVLNELKFGKFDLRRQKYIEGPFYRFFVTNVAGMGTIRLFVSRGYHAASEPLEAINRAELAARLGSPVTFDRRGDVLWVENFESGIASLEKTLSGLGAEVAWSSERALRGGYSCKMTAGSTADYYAEVKGVFPFPTLSKIGYEAAVTFDTNMDYLESYLNFYTGTLLLSFGYKYDRVAEIAYVLTPGLPPGTWTEIATGLTPYFDSYSFNFSKIVIDTPNLKYDRILAGPRLYDVSSYSCSYSVDPSRARMEMVYKYFSQAGFNAVTYFDCAIVTQNEP